MVVIVSRFSVRIVNQNCQFVAHSLSTLFWMFSQHTQRDEKGCRMKRQLVKLLIWIVKRVSSLFIEAAPDTLLSSCGASSFTSNAVRVKELGAVPTFWNVYTFKYASKLMITVHCRIASIVVICFFGIAVAVVFLAICLLARLCGKAARSVHRKLTVDYREWSLIYWKKYWNMIYLDNLF